MTPRQMTALLLLPLLLFATLSVPSTSAMTTAEKGERQAEKVKEVVTDLGVGRDSVVRVRLRDNEKLTGYPSAIREQSFDVTDGAGVATTVPYTNVAQISGQNLTTGQKVAIGVGIAAAVIGILALILYREACHKGQVACSN